MIKAIAFDYDGVIKMREGDIFADICNYLNIKREDWEREYFLVNHLINTNKKSVSEVISSIVFKFTNNKELEKGVLNLIENYKNIYYLNNELINFIKDLKNKYYKIALISNNSIKLRERLVEDGIIELFDEVIISAEVGFQKPQPEIFKILSHKLAIKLNEFVFIDDSLRCLEDADKIGYIPILYKDNKSLKINLLNILKDHEK